MNAYTHPLYMTWQSMKHRCMREKDSNYPRYGGRGISVCPEWLHFWTFLFDLGSRPEDASLDRIDNDGPYAPWNCRWATRTEQSRNARTNRLLTHKGVTKCHGEWAEFFGVDRSAVLWRVRRYGEEHAFDKPFANDYRRQSRPRERQP